MKPINLKIKGINSFLDEQEIDFSRLSEKGLFGIFGPTGSGKSTIIDAITLALFGEMSRFEGERSKPFINTQSDTAWVCFSFALFYEGENCIFTAERSFKKQKDSLKSVKARLVKECQGETIIITDQTRQLTEEIEKLLGLSYKDFSRSVVLPQGKFSRFLLLANLERKNMLERIFGLEKYGDEISNGVRNKYKEVKTELESIEKQLELYGFVTEQMVLQDQEWFYKLMEKQENINMEFEKEKEEYESLKNLFVKYSDLKNYIFERSMLLKSQAETEALRIKESNGVSAGKITPVYNEIKRIEKLKAENLSKLAEVDKQFFEKETKSRVLEELYHQWKKEKEENYPVLTEKKVKLQRGAEIQREIRHLEGERKSLLSEYKKTEQLLELLFLENKALADEKALNTEKIVQWEEEKKKVYIDETERKTAEEAFYLQNKQTEFKDKIQEIQRLLNENAIKICQIKKDIEENENKLILLSAELDAKEKQTENEKILLASEGEKLSEVKEKYVKEETTLKIAIEQYDTYVKLKSQMETSLKEKNDLTETQREIKSERESLNNLLDKLSADLKDIEKINLASILAEGLSEDMPCPVCGSTAHPSPAKKTADTIFENIKAKLEKTKAFIEQKIDEENKVNEKITYLLARISFLEKEIQGILPEEGFNPSERKQYLKELKELSSALENSIKSREGIYIEEERNIKILREEKNKLEKSLAVEKERYLNFKENQAKLAKEQATLNAQHEEIVLSLEEYEKLLHTTDFKKKYEEVQEFAKISAELERKMKGHRSIQEDIDLKMKSVQEKYSQNDKYLENIKVQGIEKRQVIERYNKELKEISDGREDITLYLQEILEKIKEIEENYNQYETALTAAKKEFEEIKSGKLQYERENNTLDEFIAKNKADFKDMLKAYGFYTEENYIEASLTKEEMEEISGRIKAFDLKLSNLDTNINILEKELKEKNTEKIEERIVQKADLIETYTKELQILTESIALLRRDIEDKSINLQKTKALRERETVLLKRSGHLEDLAKVFEGKRFVDYVAKRHLTHISADASGRLKEMSGGRYAIELIETDFVIRDDFNGGVKRSPKTLSGGETFMASLCLALALSTKVQMGSRSSLEFFFLDEGFGSLDGEVMNTVMDSLVKLKNQNIKVGLISHVEEMKNQMPNKLIVEPPVPGVRGTAIRLE